MAEDYAIKAQYNYDAVSPPPVAPVLLVLALLQATRVS